MKESKIVKFMNKLGVHDSNNGIVRVTTDNFVYEIKVTLPESVDTINLTETSGSVLASDLITGLKSEITKTYVQAHHDDTLISGDLATRYTELDEELFNRYNDDPMRVIIYSKLACEYISLHNFMYLCDAPDVNLIVNDYLECGGVCNGRPVTLLEYANGDTDEIDTKLTTKAKAGLCDIASHDDPVLLSSAVLCYNNDRKLLSVLYKLVHFERVSGLQELLKDYVYHEHQLPNLNTLLSLVNHVVYNVRMDVTIELERLNESAVLLDKQPDLVMAVNNKITELSNLLDLLNK